MQLLTPDLIDGMNQALVQGGRTVSQRLMPLSESLLGGIVTLQMIGFGLNALMESWVGDQLGAVLARLVRLILMVGLVSWLLSDYDEVFYQALYGLGTEVVNAVAGAQGEKQTFSTAWSVFMDLMLSMWHLIESMPNSILQGGNPMQWQFWGAIVSVFGSLILLFGCLGGFFVALVFVALVHVMGAALTGLGLALGPIFIPWILAKETRPIFETWLRFLLTASFYRVVAVTLMTLASPIFVSLQNFLTNGNDPLQSQSALDILMSTLSLFVVSSMIAGMMAKVPQLTAALIGHARIDTGLVSNAGRDIMRAVQRISNRNSRTSSARPRSREAKS